MTKVQTSPQSAADHTEALNRTAIFTDAGTGKKLMAIRHTVLAKPGTAVYLTGITGGDLPSGVAF